MGPEVAVVVADRGDDPDLFTLLESAFAVWENDDLGTVQLAGFDFATKLGGGALTEALLDDDSSVWR